MSFLRQFPNLLLDEVAPFDFINSEVVRMRRAARLTVRDKLKKIRLDESDYTGDITNDLNTFSLGRRLFLHDELGIEHLPRYETEKDIPAYYAKQNGKIGQVMDETVTVPTFQVSHRTSKHAIDWFLRKENDAFFSLLENVETEIEVETLTSKSISDGFRPTEKRDLVVHSVLVGDQAMEVINEMDFDRATAQETRYRPYFVGHLWTADVYHFQHPMLAHRSYFLPRPDCFGVFANRGSFSTGPIHTETWGMALIYPHTPTCLRVLS